MAAMARRAAAALSPAARDRLLGAPTTLGLLSRCRRLLFQTSAAANFSWLRMAWPWFPPSMRQCSEIMPLNRSIHSIAGVNGSGKRVATDAPTITVCGLAGLFGAVRRLRGYGRCSIHHANAGAERHEG